MSMMLMESQRKGSSALQHGYSNEREKEIYVYIRVKTIILSRMVDELTSTSYKVDLEVLVFRMQF